MRPSPIWWATTAWARADADPRVRGQAVNRPRTSSPSKPSGGPATRVRRRTERARRPTDCRRSAARRRRARPGTAHRRVHLDAPALRPAAALQHDGASFFAEERSSLRHTTAGRGGLDSAARSRTPRRQAATARTLLTFERARRDREHRRCGPARPSRSRDHRVRPAVVVLVDPTRRSHTLRRRTESDEAISLCAPARFEIGRPRFELVRRERRAGPVPFDIAKQSKRFGRSANVVSIVSNGELIGWLLRRSPTNPNARARSRDPRPACVVSPAGGYRDSQARLVEEAHHKALHDSLTGLPNRALVLDRTSSRSRAQRHHTIASVLSSI